MYPISINPYLSHSVYVSHPLSIHICLSHSVMYPTLYQSISVCHILCMYPTLYQSISVCHIPYIPPCPRKSQVIPLVPCNEHLFLCPRWFMLPTTSRPTSGSTTNAMTTWRMAKDASITPSTRESSTTSWSSSISGNHPGRKRWSFWVWMLYDDCVVNFGSFLKLSGEEVDLLEVDIVWWVSAASWSFHGGRGGASGSGPFVVILWWALAASWSFHGGRCRASWSGHCMVIVSWVSAASWSFHGGRDGASGSGHYTMIVL